MGAIASCCKSTDTEEAEVGKGTSTPTPGATKGHALHHNQAAKKLQAILRNAHMPLVSHNKPMNFTCKCDQSCAAGHASSD